MTTVTATGWTMDDSTFGARLALVRLRMDWNLKEAAKECALPAASWRTWERAAVSPRHVVETALLISQRTGCDYMWLLTGRTGGRGATEGYRAKRVKQQVRTVTSGRPSNTAPSRPPSYPRGQRRPLIIGHHSTP